MEFDIISCMTKLWARWNFSHEGMTARYNADLANNLGNLLSRVTVVASKCDGIGPAPEQESPLASIVEENMGL